jgi:hypothetical protein
MASSPPRKRLYTRIPTRLFTPEAQPSQFVDEMTHDTRPPSPSAFIEEPVLDSPHTLSDTANTRFAESPRDLDTPKVPHLDDTTQGPNSGVLLDSRQVRTIGRCICVCVYIYIYNFSNIHM